MKYQSYIGTKIIEAMACDAGHAASMLNRDVKAPVNDPGYLVVYPDGYKSWSPKKAFDEAYRPSEAMPFGLAIEAMQKGHSVARKGWNGKNTCIFYIKGRTVDGEMFRSRPNKANDIWAADPEVVLVGHIDMRAADGSYVTGWSPSQPDMLSDDWFIVD